MCTISTVSYIAVALLLSYLYYKLVVAITSNHSKYGRFLLQQLSLVTDLIRFVSRREFLPAFSRSARFLLAWPVFLGRHGPK